MRKILYLLLFVCLGMSLLVSCKTSTEPEVYYITGTWTRTDGVTYKIVFTATTYDVDTSGDGVTDEVSGTYTQDGNQITMNDNGAPGPGVYTVAITATTLTFTLVSDGTADRVNVLVGVWNRQTTL